MSESLSTRLTLLSVVSFPVSRQILPSLLRMFPPFEPQPAYFQAEPLAYNLY